MTDAGPPARGSASSAAAVEMAGIVKRYGSVVANDGIDLTVARGEIHALMGENGAGKSTLMSILYGLVQPDAGTISLRGVEKKLPNPTHAIAEGLGMVHQAFRLFPSLTVWENIVYGREPRRRHFIDRDAGRAQVVELAQRYGLSVDPNARVSALPVGVRQRIEILKALYRDAQVLILDEPTAVLTPGERDALFDVLRALSADGRTIVLVTHKIPEVLAVSDTITVLRDGRVAERLATTDATAERITRAMTGRNVLLTVPRADPETNSAPGPVLLDVRNVCVSVSGRRLVDDASLQVRAGEIVGIAGVAGNGQSELVEAITGLRRPSSGTVTLQGHDVSSADVATRRRAGLAYIPEDRAATGTARAASAADNLVMGAHRDEALSRHGVLRTGRVRARGRELIERFAIRIPDERRAVAELSGGNLQKVVVARELTHEAPVLIAEQPTRGVDVGAIEFIHGRLVAERARGRGVLLVSAELTEVLSLSDRILVMYEGRIVADLRPDQTSEAEVGLLMAGGASHAMAAIGGAAP